MTDPQPQRPQRRLRHTAVALAPRRPDYQSVTEAEVSSSSAGSTKQSAFVFIKPHADTPSVRSLVSSHLTAAGCTITATGTFSGPEIASEGFIDKHYYSSNSTNNPPTLGAVSTFSDSLLAITVASKATLLQPAELNVTPAVFAGAFGTHFQHSALRLPALALWVLTIIMMELIRRRVEHRAVGGESV